MNFAKDGAGKNFETQKTKLIFIGKETVDTDNTFDWRKYLDNGVFYDNKKVKNKPFENFYNVYRWSKFLLDGPMDFFEYQKIEKNREKRVSIFSKIVFMNIKKESGKSYSNTDEIIKVGKEDKKYLSKQLDLYLNKNDIKILFLLGNGIYTSIKDIIKEKYQRREKLFLNDNDRFIEFYDDNLFIIKFYHFKARIGLNISYDLIQKVYDFIKKHSN